MKGKFKVFNKIMIALVILLTASLCFGIKFKSSQNNDFSVYAWSDNNQEDYSALFGGNVIFSVERVSINSETDADKKTFYGYNASEKEETEYYFSNIVQDGKTKQVVENGDFVMLENKYIGGTYINQKTNRPDGIMISLGQYVYKNDGDVSITKKANAQLSTDADYDSNVTDEDYAQITRLEVAISKDDEPIKSLEIRDTYSKTGYFQDFVYLIEEDGSNIEGRYDINVKYMKGGADYTGTFSFYLVCETSYTQTKTVNGQTYSAAPNLGWVGYSEQNQYTEAVAGNDGYVHYYEGVNGYNYGSNNENVDTISYPTITYDYTKYKMSYTLTNNKTVKKYDFTYSKLDTSEVEFVCTVSGGENDQKKRTFTNYNQSMKLVTVVLTEEGSYHFSFEYLYTGKLAKNEETAPSMEKLKIDDKYLTIHGSVLNYSKSNYAGTEFRKLKFSTNEEARVGLFVPDGYMAEDNIEKYKNKELGFLYSVDKNSYRLTVDKNIRVGQIIVSDEDDRTEETLQNYKFANINTMATNITNTSSYTSVDLSGINYIKSDQGSMWISVLNDEFVNGSENSGVISGSFYFYSKTEINNSNRDALVEKDGGYITVTAAKLYNNQVSFNKIGYYLVFLKIKPSVGVEFYQVYAFQYSSSTVDINVVTAENEPNVVAAGGYTRQNVVVSWANTETFESVIKCYYHKTTNVNASRDQLLTAQGTEIKTNFGFEIGSDIQEGSFAKYLIRLERAGKSATYKTFTIDRQGISGVGAYVVKSRISGKTIYYTYDVDGNNNEKLIANGITDSPATLSWNLKASGAAITATYSFTPIVKDTSINPSIVNDSANDTWISTNYKLGNTISGFELDLPSSKSNVTSNSILFSQGIYVFTLTDEAGNACKYMLIIDNTEAFLEVDDGKTKEIVGNEYRLYGDDISYTAGDYKVLALTTTNVELSNIISNAIAETLGSYKDTNQVKFYNGENSLNITAMQNLFDEFSGTNYLMVKNEKVVAYDGDIIDTDSSSAQGTTNGRVQYGNLDGATSLTRKLYVVSANSKYSSIFRQAKDSNSYFDLEINKDNSRGMAYYSNSQFGISMLPANGSSSDSVKRLFTGSDELEADDITIKTSGINKAKATMDKYVGFTWLFGEDKFAIGEIIYNYYSLDTANYDANKYFYKLDVAASNKEIFANGTLKLGERLNDRGFYLFDTNYDGTTKEGLYEVVRTYVDPNADYGDDSYRVNYYFIVDRNGIINVTKEIGTKIELVMMKETSISGADFSLVSAKDEEFKYIDGNKLIEDNYYIYLKTNKLPATLNIPTGKYTYVGEEKYLSNKYESGQLKFAVYYHDVYGQIDTNRATYKIFEREGTTDYNEYYYEIDIYDFLTNVEPDTDLRDRLIISESSTHKDWLSLPGRYIIWIEDNVQSSADFVNKKIIGFEIVEPQNPETDVLVGASKEVDKMGEVVTTKISNGNYSVVTNQEFIRVELPKYESNNKMAQVDTDYIYVAKNGVEYIHYNYEVITSNLLDDSGKKYVYLETFLRDSSGNILPENFKQPLVYTLVVRYKVGTSKADSNIYAGCYSYFNAVGERVYYYTSTYTITIDRQAPTTNVEALRSADVLISGEFVDAEFEHSYYEESQVYFTYQYADYYSNGKNLSDIYAFRVTPTTEIDYSDVNELYYTRLRDVRRLSLSLPVVSNYGTERTLTGKTTYGNVLGSAGYGYYRILELDKAGNMTEYVVYYAEDKAESLNLPIEYKTTWGETRTINLGEADPNVNSLELFEIKAGGDVTNNNGLGDGDYFYHVSLTSSNADSNWEDLNISTNFATAYTGDESLVNIIANTINGKRGYYQLTIVPRSGEVYNLGISLYGEEDQVTLNAKDLIIESGGKYQIDLQRANKLVNGIMYYAKEIVVTQKGETTEAITTTYYCKPINGTYPYFYMDGLVECEVINSRINCLDNTTYKISLTDVLNRTPSPARFNTAGKEFYKVEFENNANYFIDNEYNYYAFTGATVTFDGLFSIDYSSITAKVDGLTVNASDYVTINGQTVTISPVYNEETGKGGILKVELQFYEGITIDEKYTIIIDTSTQAVALKDFTSGDSKDLKVFKDIDLTNLEILKTQCKPTESSSGIMNLSWTPEIKDYFVYTYSLYELKKNDEIQSLDVSSLKNYVIDTADDSLGVYWFVISVYSFDGKYVGNKIYAFDVQQVNNSLYYVKNADNVAIKANSYFVKRDVEDYTFYVKEDGVVTNKLASFTLPSIDLPLYVSNQLLSVVLTENITAKEYVAGISNDQTITIYEIDAVTYKVYIGILYINQTDSLVNDMKVGDENIGDKELAILVSNNNPEYILTSKRNAAVGDNYIDGILTKNILLLDIYYNGEFVKTIEFNGSINPYMQYKIAGNGNYSFRVRDLAGNENVFGNDTKQVQVLVLREIVVTINGKNHVQNAYYNDAVELKVFASGRFVTGSVYATATRNGEELSLSPSNTYVFDKYGTYTVTIYANYQDSNDKIIPLKKDIHFSIINVKEARNSIDLSNMSMYEIVKVTNPSDVDVTNTFKRILNNKANGKLITYSDIMANARDLKVSSGKLTFTVEYLIPADIYPERNFVVKFTLNNEKPVVNCSLEIGEQTTKGFDISFNPAIIYDQIGESILYINDIEYEIVEGMPNDVVTLSVTYKKDGDGDYYVTLVGTSGNVWESFKVTIKEPLNAGAIIIIVVVVAVVATVATTIIILRRKMRIR